METIIEVNDESVKMKLADISTIVQDKEFIVIDSVVPIIVETKKED